MNPCCNAGDGAGPFLSLGGLGFLLAGCASLDTIASAHWAELFGRFQVPAPGETVYTLSPDPVALDASGASAAYESPDLTIFGGTDALRFSFGSGRHTLVVWPLATRTLELHPVAGGKEAGCSALQRALAALRYGIPFVLARNNGLLLHAAAVVRESGGYLFVGPSGRGKSTIARLMAQSGAEVLSDEHPIVRHGADGVHRVYGSPWPSARSSCASARSAPLKRIFFLEQAAENRVEAIAPPQAFLRFRQDPFFFFPTYALAFLDPLLTSMQTLLQLVPAAVLHFRPTPDVAAMVRDA